jgi:prepilin-type N-terminal cleavage/methylation domain-containing protein
MNSSFIVSPTANPDPTTERKAFAPFIKDGDAAGNTLPSGDLSHPPFAWVPPHVAREMSCQKKAGRKAGFTLVEIIIVCAIVGLLCAMIIPNFVRSRTTSQMNGCIENLRLIDAAKQQWATEHHQGDTSTPKSSDLQPYLGRGSAGEMPICPADSQAKPTFATSYDIEILATKPTCKRVPATHVLP